MPDKPEQQRTWGQIRREPTDPQTEQRPIEGATRARAGQVLRAGLMRRVLVTSLALVIIAFVAIYLVFFITQSDDEAAPPPEAPIDEELEPPLPPGD